MSIATLKKKTQARYFPHSVPGKGFSLYGAARLKGPGEVSLGSSVTRTPFRGAFPVGHGGGNGQYPVHIIRSGEPVPQTVVKRAVMSYHAFFDLKEMQSLNRQGCHWVKDKNTNESDINRICIAKTQPKRCEDLNTTINGGGSICKKETLVTKAKPGPISYDMLYMARDWKTRTCAVPSWPPRINNTSCAKQTITKM